MLPQASYHVDAIQRVVSGDVKGVYAPAVLFGGSMDQWDSGLTQRLVDTLSTLNKRGITVWLRFCYEMVRSYRLDSAFQALTDFPLCASRTANGCHMATSRSSSSKCGAS